MNSQFFVFACVAVLCGCGTDSNDDLDGHKPTDSMFSCTTRVDAFSMNVARDTKNGLYTVQFLAADPMPPDVGENSWTLKVSDSANVPVTGAQITAEPLMPQHGHGSFPPTFTFTQGTDPGSYMVSKVGLHMSGHWKITFTVAGSDGNADKITFSFCLEG